MNDGRTRQTESLLPRIIDYQRIRDSQIHSLEADRIKLQIGTFLPDIASEFETQMCASDGFSKSTRELP